MRGGNVAGLISSHFSGKFFKDSVGRLPASRVALWSRSSSSFIDALKATNGQTITCKAAVAWEPKTKLDVTDIQVSPPKAGEVRIKNIANALCHTDIYTLDGFDPEGLFPCVLGHEAASIVESVGEGVTSVAVGDVVIPCYTPECKKHDCIFCESPKTNLCPSIRATQGQGLMPDGTSRMHKDGTPLFHFMGCSTFAEYSVIAEISAAKINPGADLNKICMLGCGVATGWGAVFNNCKLEPQSSVVVYGLGALGLAAIQAAKASGAGYIVGVDLLESKFDLAKQLGADVCISPKTVGSTRSWLLEQRKWGYDYTFDCTGNVHVMREALEVAHRGWGQSCVIGVAAAGQEISTRPFQLVTGREWKGTAFGGWKARTEVPKLVQTVMRGELNIDPYVTHTFKGLDKVNDSIEALHSGDCLRAIVEIADSPFAVAKTPSLKGNVKVEGGKLQQLSHWSDVCQCEMTFSIFLPELKSRTGPPPPVVFYLSGLTCTDENARTKAHFARAAAEEGLCVVFPDTSPRGVNIPGEDDSYDFGSGAGFYVNATVEPWARHYQMYDYVTKELPGVIESFYYVDMERQSIMGHSMGGHGALVAHLRNPGRYKSVSAFAPISHPTSSDWGRKQFEGYLGSMDAGKAYDAVVLADSYQGPKVPLLVDQGTSDPFLESLQVDKLYDAFKRNGLPIELRMQPLYDHSYFFISTFMKDHVKFHAKALFQ